MYSDRKNVRSKLKLLVDILIRRSLWEKEQERNKHTKTIFPLDKKKIVLND